MAVTTEYLSGGRIQGRSDDSLATAVPATSWKEIARYTLTSTSSSIVVGTGTQTGSGTGTGYFTAKDNLMVLVHALTDSRVIHMKFGNSNTSGIDSGSNYNGRRNRNGGDDSSDTSVSTGFRIVDEDAGNDAFCVVKIRNMASEEKLLISHAVENGTVGNNAPNREEFVGKWTNTNQLTTLSITTAGDLASGSEIVVLGMDDDEVDSGTNFWQELVSQDGSGSSQEVDSGAFTNNRKYLWVESYGTTAGNNMDNIGFKFNTASTNYSRRIHHNYSSTAGGASGNDTASSGAQSYMRFGSGSAAANDIFIDGHIVNVSGKEKLLVGHCNRNRSTGAGNTPDSFEITFKWSDTSAPISSIKLINDTSNWTTDSYIRVYGAD